MIMMVEIMIMIMMVVTWMTMMKNHQKKYKYYDFQSKLTNFRCYYLASLLSSLSVVQYYILASYHVLHGGARS